MFPSHGFAQPQTDANASAPIHIKQGEAFLFTLQAGENVEKVQGYFHGRTIPFFKMKSPDQFGALIGVDLADPPSEEELRVEISTAQGSVEQRRFRIDIAPVQFETQELTVPKTYVDLDEETAKRAEEEQEKILQSLKTVTVQRLWEGRFVIPVEGKISGSFGLRRMINGQARSPHSGEDIKAPKGTEVHAMNEGVVALVGDFFFSGKSVIVDHGLGLFSMYFHLDEVDVAEGATVRKGSMIGRVGATGRATGPHLHWGARINGARVNPLSILAIE